MHSEINEKLVQLAYPQVKDMQKLLNDGANFNEVDVESDDTPFNDIVLSVCAGDTITECLRLGASPNPISTKGTSPLTQAAMANDYRTMMILLEGGANPNIACFSDEDSQTPLDIVFNEFHCTRRPADIKICEAMEMILREFGGKTYQELRIEKQNARTSSSS
jgi:ankyrin repeat protein